MCDNVLPNLQKIASPEDGVDGQLEILKMFAEISEFCGDIDKVEERVTNIYNCLIVRVSDADISSIQFLSCRVLGTMKLICLSICLGFGQLYFKEDHLLHFTVYLFNSFTANVADRRRHSRLPTLLIGDLNPLP